MSGVGGETLPCSSGALGLRRGDRRAGVVPRPDDHRELELVAAHVVAQHVHVGDLDVHFLAGADVADRLGEDVRPLLLQQGRRLAGQQGLFVDPPSFLAALDYSHDPPLGDDHRHVVHRRFVRQREDVHRFDLLIGGIDEGLRHLDAGNEPGDIGHDIGMLQGAFDYGGVVLDDPQGPLSHVLFESRLFVLCRRGVRGKSRGC